MFFCILNPRMTAQCVTSLTLDTPLISLDLSRVWDSQFWVRLASSRLKLAHAIQQAEFLRQVPALTLSGVVHAEMHPCSLQRMI